MRLTGSITGALLLAATALAAPAHAANIVDITNVYIAGGSTTLTNSTGFDFKPLNFNKSVSVGKIYGSSFTGHYGAKVTASVGASLDLNGGLSFSDTISRNNIGTTHIVAGGQSNPGSSFILATGLDTPSVNFGVGTGQIDASLNATAFAGANIHGKACVVGCISGDIANLGIGSPYQQTILAYQSETNTVTFLGQTYNNALPQHYEAGGYVPITADVNAVNLAGAGSGAFNSGTASYHSQQTVAGAYIDVAGAIANAFGVPTDALYGSVLGFDYTTVSAKVGAAINVAYDVTAQAFGTGVSYMFSTAMQAYSAKKGGWVNVGKEVTGFDGGFSQLRTVDPTVKSVSVLPMVFDADQINATLSVSASLEDHIKLLEVSGHGLDAGPLYKQDATVGLGKIASFSQVGVDFAQTALKPFTLTFDAASKLNTLAAYMSADGGSDETAGSDAFVFVPTGTPDDQTISGFIKLATNFGTTGCNDESVGRCVYDESFAPIAEQERITRGATGAPIYTYATDFLSYDELLAQGFGPQGMQASDASIEALLASLPGSKFNYDTGPDIAFNTTPFTDGPGEPDEDAVPEPASWAMMIGGLGLVGGAMRRRRRSMIVSYA